MHIRESILTTDASQVLAITPHCYMGHVYLTGFVANQAQADDVVARVRAMEGVRTVDTYLVPKPSDRSLASDEMIKPKLKAQLALSPGEVATRVESEVLAGHVVLLGRRVVAAGGRRGRPARRAHERRHGRDELPAPARAGVRVAPAAPAVASGLDDRERLPPVDRGGAGSRAARAGCRRRRGRST
jgi:hypothetical protein